MHRVARVAVNRSDVLAPPTAAPAECFVQVCLEWGIFEGSTSPPKTWMLQ